MAFMKYINDPIGILTLVVLTLPSIAANIDCFGKPFHCVNSTHFMICVDLGSGVSSTIDDFVIPCPPTTVCQGTNRFECEFPAVPNTTTTVITPSAAPQVTSVSETTGIGTLSSYGGTTTIEEYFNTLSTTTLSEDVLLTQQAIVTESILVTDVIDKTDVTPEFESNSTLSGTIPRATNFTPLNNLSSPAFPTNVSNTVTESIFTGEIETTPNINVELNLTARNSAFPDNTVTENINLIEPNLTSNGTIPSGNILGNDSTTHYTLSYSVLADNADAIVKKNIVTEETESENVIRPEPNTILSETSASVDVVPNDITLLNRSSSTGKGTESFATNVADITNVLKPESSPILSETLARIDSVVNDLTSFNDSGSTAISDTEAKVTSMTENLNVLQPNNTFTEALSSVDVVQNDLTLLNASSSTYINIKAVNHVTENINVLKPGPNTTSTETSANVEDVTHDLTSIDASSSTTIDTESVTNVTENLNVFEPEPNTIFSQISESDDVIKTQSTSFNASNSTSIDIEAINNVTENITVLKPGPNTLLRKTPRVDDVITHYPTSLDAPSSTAIESEAVTHVKEDINVITPVPNTLSRTLGSGDFVTHDPTSLDALNSTATNTESVTNVTENVNVSKTEPTTKLSETPESVVVLENNSTSLNTSTTTAIDSKNMIENIKVMKPDLVTILNEIPARIDVILNDPISLTTSSNTAVDTEAVTNVTDSINVIKPELNTTLGGILTSFDVVLNDPTSLNASSSTAIDSISNDVMQNEFTTHYTSNSTASLINVEPITPDNLLINVNETNKVNKIENYRKVTGTKVNTTSSAGTTSKTYQGSSTIFNTIDVVETTPSNFLETTIPTQDIDSVTYSNVYHTNTENIGNNQEVLINQTDGKTVHSEKVLSTSTIKNITSIPTLVIKDNGITVTDFLVSVTDNPLEHPVSQLKSSSNIDSISLDTYSTKTIKKPFTDIPVSELPTEVTPSLVTDTTRVITALDTAVVNDNILNETRLESNSTKKSVQAKNEDGSELSPYFTAPEFVSTTESPKEIYFISSKQHTSIVGDERSTAVNDYKQLVTKYNKPMDSTSISSIDKSSAGDTNIPVITESVDEFTNTEQNTLATIFTITKTGQEFNSELSNVVSITESAYLTLDYLQNTIKVGKVSAVNEAATIATTSTTTDSSKSFDSTNINHHPTKEVENINVTAFISETDTDKLHNTRPTVENRPVTSMEEVTLLEVNTVSSTTSSVPEFEPTTTEMITTTAANNSYVEPPIYTKSVETTSSSIFNSQSDTKPSLANTNGANGIGDVLSINFNASQTKISRNSLNTDQDASSTVTQELVTGLSQTELPVENSTKGIVITNTLELSTGSLENTLPTNSSGDGNSLTNLTDSYSSVNEAEFTVEAAGENIMYKNNDIGTANIDVEAITRNQRETVKVTTIKVDELYEKLISKTSTQIITLMEKKAFAESIKKEIYPEPNILNTGSGKPSEISTSIKDMPDVQIKTKSRVIPLIETSQAKQIVVSGQAEQSPVDYLGSVTTLHSIATETQIPEEVQQQQSPTANYEDTSHNQQNAVSQQGSTPLHNSDIQTTNYLIITQHIKKNTSKIQIEMPTNPNTNKDTKMTNNASLTKVNRNTETNVLSAFDNQPFVKAKMQNQYNTVEDSHIVAQNGSTSSHLELSKIFSPTSNRNSDTLSHLEQNTESWRTTVVTNPSVQRKNLVIDKQPLITTTRPASEPGKITKIEGINVRNAGPILDVVISNIAKQFFNVTQVTSPSINVAKPLIVATSTTEPPSEPSNKILKPLDLSSALDPFITNPNIVAEQPLIVTSTRSNTIPWRTTAEADNVPRNIDGGQTTVGDLVSIPKKEFINVPRIVTGQTEQMITQSSLDLNSAVDIMTPINANFVLGEPMGSGTHSEISVILKPPLKSPVQQNQNTEASESVEKFEGNRGKNKSENSEGEEWVRKPETLETIEGEHNVGSSAIETTVILNDSKFDNVNDNIDQKVTGTKLQYTTYNIILESTIEMTTKKVEEKPDQSISNIELYSSTVNSTIKKSAQTNVTYVVSPDLKEKSVKIKPIIVTAHISNNITSDVRNSTARYTPQTKSPLANKHNASVPILKPATNSHKFVCKLNKRGRFSDIKDCRKFYICLGRVEPIEGICPNNTVFSELRKQCTKNLSHCVRNSQFQCVSEGRFSDFLNDSIYYICVKNNVGKFIRFKLQCQSGYHLNKTSVRCALNTESNQSTSQQSTSDISKDNYQNVSMVKSERLVKEPSKNTKFECKKEGKFPEASNCRKYYICTKIGKSQYQQKSKKCDSDELFHKDKKKCVDADSYECT